VIAVCCEQQLTETVQFSADSLLRLRVFQPLAGNSHV